MIAGDPDTADSISFQDGREVQNFVRRSRVTQEENDIILSNATKISMDGFRGMHDMRRDAKAAERGRNLCTDESGFAHSTDDDVPGAVGDQLDRLAPVSSFASRSRGRDPIGDMFDCFRLATEDFRKKASLFASRGDCIALRRRFGWLDAHRGV